MITSRVPTGVPTGAPQKLPGEPPKVGAPGVAQGETTTTTTKPLGLELKSDAPVDVKGSGLTQCVAKSRVLTMPAFDPKQPAEAQLMVAGTGIGGGPLARLAEQGFQVKFFEAGPPQRDWFCDVPLLRAAAEERRPQAWGVT